MSSCVGIQCTDESQMAEMEELKDHLIEAQANLQASEEMKKLLMKWVVP